MSFFDISKVHSSAALHAMRDSDRPAPPKQSVSQQSDRAPEAGVAVETNGTLETAKPPVDAERVAEIRAALRDGSYPIVPAKIADAMIAAKLMLSTSE